MKKYCKAIIAIALVATLLLLGGCAPAPTVTQNTTELVVICTLFPQYSLVKEIAGPHANVTLLLPPGTDAHSYEPTPSDMRSIHSAGLLLYTSPSMEPWAQTLVAALPDTVQGIDLSVGIPLRPEYSGQHFTNDGHDDHAHLNPHYWLSPPLAKMMVDNIAAALIAADSANADLYSQNAEICKTKFDNLQTQLDTIVAEATVSHMVFAGSCSIGYLLEDMHITYTAAADSCAQGAEPSLRRVIQLSQEVRAYNLPVVYYEELSTPQVARALQEETGATGRMLYTGHNITPTQLEQGVSYFDLMQDNILHLKEGLCF